ncbi:hypothetical protein [Microbacterium sp. PMB16]|uniref:hypothetical protein n=1 Tax=Microbacterium sp. PMB16 TaxID=3120157 RepID=UPI003F4C9AE5
MRNPLLPRLAAAGALVTVGLLATGCSVIDAVAHHQKSSSFADAADLASNGEVDVPWLPKDSVAIRVTQSTEADDASVAVDSAEDLSADQCKEVPRQSAPAYSIDDTVDVYGLSTVFACGAWSVAKTPSGWLGWTPNHPDEKAQSPAS